MGNVINLISLEGYLKKLKTKLNKANDILRLNQQEFIKTRNIVNLHSITTVDPDDLFSTEYLQNKNNGIVIK